MSIAIIHAASKRLDNFRMKAAAAVVHLTVSTSYLAAGGLYASVTGFILPISHPNRPCSALTCHHPVGRKYIVPSHPSKPRSSAQLSAFAIIGLSPSRSDLALIRTLVHEIPDPGSRSQYDDIPRRACVGHVSLSGTIWLCMIARMWRVAVAPIISVIPAWVFRPLQRHILSDRTVSFCEVLCILYSIWTTICFLMSAPNLRCTTETSNLLSRYTTQSLAEAPGRAFVPVRLV